MWVGVDRVKAIETSDLAGGVGVTTEPCGGGGSGNGVMGQGCDALSLNELGPV